MIDKILQSIRYITKNIFLRIYITTIVVDKTRDTLYFVKITLKRKIKISEILIIILMNKEP